MEYPRKIKSVNKLIYITLDNGKIVKCTPDHIFYKRTGEEVEAQYLSIGDSLYPLYIANGTDVKNQIVNHNKWYLESYKCIYDASLNGYTYIHYLADDYNERHNLYVDYLRGKGHWVRHHVDFNKFNNNPTNIVRMTWDAHQKLHKDSVTYTNNLGISGFKRAAELNPNFYSNAGKKRAASTWNNTKNGIANRKNTSNRTKALNEQCILNSVAQRNASSTRMKNNNPTKFSVHNTEEWMKNKQKLGKIKKVALKCFELYGSFNEQYYNTTITDHFYYAYPKYNTALEFLNKFNLSFEQLIDDNYTISNHKIIDICTIDCENAVDVFCLTCKEFGNFALSAGVFVHNCGMLCAELDLTVEEATSEEFLGELDDTIHRFVPAGFAIHDRPWARCNALDDLLCWSSADLKRAVRSVGTLGGGNHFIELNVSDNTGKIYLVIHSGSRNLGVQVCKFYQDLAFKNLNEMKSVKKQITDKVIARCKAEGRKKDIQKELEKALANIQKPACDKELAHLTGSDFNNYIHDMEIVQNYAVLNRATMLKIITSKMNVRVVDSFETIHNYIDTKNMILRKGAVSAQTGETLLIPMNMRDGSLICVGKGNPDWNCSAPHGAGRLMSRAQAKKNISMDDYRQSMKGIYTTSVNYNTIDESPMAYKNTEEIMRCIEPTVDIIDVIRPIYNFKAADKSMFEDK